jgi:hypothetical protein
MTEKVISLTKSERDRFAAWLEQDAQASVGIAEGFSKLGHEIVVKKLKDEAAAFLIVARKLRNMEDMTIGGIEKS